MDLPYPIFRVWTDPRTSESLDSIFKWSFKRLMQANEWLNILDAAESTMKAKAEREAKRKK